MHFTLPRVERPILTSWTIRFHSWIAQILSQNIHLHFVTRKVLCPIKISHITKIKYIWVLKFCFEVKTLKSCVIFTSVKDELRTNISGAYFFITSVHINNNGGNGTDLRVFTLKSILLWMIERCLLYRKPRVPLRCYCAK